MSFTSPGFLFAFLAVPLYLWLRHRSSNRSTRTFTGSFLFESNSNFVKGRRRLELNWEDVLCVFLLVFLVLSGANFSGFAKPSVLITDGPVDMPEDVVPSAIIRAGIEPRVYSSSGMVPYVDTKPDWFSAFRHAHTHYPDHEVLVRRSVTPLLDLAGAGLRRIGSEWLFGIQSPEPSKLAVYADEKLVELRVTDQGAVTVDLKPSRVIEVSGKGKRSIFRCGSGEQVIRIKRGALPPDIERGLSLHPMLTVVEDSGDVSIVPWRAHDSSESWEVPFPISKVEVMFAPPSSTKPVTARLAKEIQTPLAQVTRWGRLEPHGQSFLLGDEHELVNYHRSGDKSQIRFGFNILDTDLTETAGWPVLMMQLGDQIASDATGCRDVKVGSVIPISATEPMYLTSPSGELRTLNPINGQVFVSGLDEVGVYRLEADGKTALLVASPSDRTNDLGEEINVPDLKQRTQNGTAQLDLKTLVMAGICLLPLCIWGTRRIWYFGVLFAVLVMPFAHQKWFSVSSQYILMLDASESMQEVDFNARNLTALSGLHPERVDFSNDIRQLVPLASSRAYFGGGTDLGASFQRLSELSPDLSGVVLVTDGRFPLNELYFDRPLILYEVSAKGADVAVVSGDALELNGQIFVRAEIRGRGIGAGTLKAGGVSREFHLNRDGNARVSLSIPKSDFDELELEVVVPEDINSSNNKISVSIERPDRSDALVFGNCSPSLTEYLAQAHRVIRLEEGVDFSTVELTVICDVPIDFIPRKVQTGLKRWVENGGTIVLAGRERSFGNGGWTGTVLDDVSPFDSEPEELGRGQIHLTVALDTSGSMSVDAGGAGLAVTSGLVNQWVSSLAETDLIQVFGFDADLRVLAETQVVADWRKQAWDLPSRLAGGTRLSNLVERLVASREHREQRKYLLLISDGEFADRDRIKSLSIQLAENGTRVLAVKVGRPEADDTQLRTLARLTGGRFIDGAAQSVSSFVGQAARDGQSGLELEGGPIHITSLWPLRIGGNAPPVRRLLRVKQKPSARLLAQFEGLPLIAERYLGLGRSIALATDSLPLSQLQWRTLLSSVFKRQRIRGDLQTDGQRLLLRLDPGVLVPEHRLFFKCQGRSFDAASWRMLSPGLFETDVPSDCIGTIEAHLSDSSRERVLRFVGSSSKESYDKASGEHVLKLLAARSGGGVARSENELAQLLESQPKAGGIESFYFMLLLAILMVIGSATRAYSSDMTS